MNTIEIYTDGSCRKNGNGAYGILILENGHPTYNEVHCESNTTNQRMEMKAIILAYNYIRDKNGIDATIYSDSAYCLNCAKDKWYERWEKNDYFTAKKTPVLNQDLWEQLVPYFKSSSARLVKVPGHQNCKYNNQIDKMVQDASANCN
jgi:ribonuclease HI